MWGFSKKRFFITLGLSVLIWGLSTTAQLFNPANKTSLGGFGLGSSCRLTGYPIAQCINIDNFSQFGILTLINILFLFWVLSLFWKLFGKR